MHTGAVALTQSVLIVTEETQMCVLCACCMRRWKGAQKSSRPPRLRRAHSCPTATHCRAHCCCVLKLTLQMRRRNWKPFCRHGCHVSGAHFHNFFVSYKLPYVPTSGEPWLPFFEQQTFFCHPHLPLKTCTHLLSLTSCLMPAHYLQVPVLLSIPQSCLPQVVPEPCAACCCPATTPHPVGAVCPGRQAPSSAPWTRLYSWRSTRHSQTCGSLQTWCVTGWMRLRQTVVRQQQYNRSSSRGGSSRSSRGVSSAIGRRERGW